MVSLLLASKEPLSAEGCARATVLGKGRRTGPAATQASGAQRLAAAICSVSRASLGPPEVVAGLTTMTGAVELRGGNPVTPAPASPAGQDRAAPAPTGRTASAAGQPGGNSRTGQSRRSLGDDRPSS
jgi:hypothetical protein